jgi:hypothetical protein
MTRTHPRDRGALSGALAAPAFMAGVAGALRMSSEPWPRPGADVEAVRGFFGQRPSPMRASVPGQLVSAVALGRFAVSVARLGGRARRGAGALRGAALAGGAVAAGSLAVSAAHGVALARDPGSDRALVRHRRMFLAGGPVHGAGFGVLLAALGTAGLRTGGLPRPVAQAAAAAAVPNLLSPLAIVAPPAAWLIPLGRFPGLLVCAIAGTALARG